MKQVPQVGDLVKIVYYGVVTDVDEDDIGEFVQLNGVAGLYTHEYTELHILTEEDNNRSALARSFDRRSHP